MTDCATPTAQPQRLETDGVGGSIAMQADRDKLRIRVDIPSQSLILLRDDIPLCSYPVSTAVNGVGEEQGSGRTPRGLHRVRIRIGADMPLNTVFVGRRPTGEIYSAALATAHPQRDWILTRVIWLTGLEPGRNRGGSRDSLRRFIYIHGCPDSEPMGVPRSHGCIRMRNTDVVELFDRIANGTLVEIRA